MRVYIQTVPERRGYLETVLFPALSDQGLTDVRPMSDHDHNGPFWNASRIWEQIAHEAEPALYLQDDVILHPAFGHHLSVIAGHGLEAVSLFAPPRNDMTRFHEDGYTFVENYRFLWMPGMILSPGFCRGLVEYARTQDTIHDDSVLGDYSRLARIPVWNVLPSLVQHNLQIRSTLGTATKVGNTVRETRVWQDDIPLDHYARVRSAPYGKPRN